MRGRQIKPILLLIIFLFSASYAIQQVETEHFHILYRKGDEYWVNKTIEIAEDVWDDLMVAYDIVDEYKKVIIQLSDGGDELGNGYTIYSKNKIVVTTTQGISRKRSDEKWLRDVLIHELSHLFSLKAASKDGFFKYFTIRKESKWDNPNTSFEYFYSPLMAPKWFVEGVSQYESYKNEGDHWDTHRDMLLRMAVLEDDLLDYVEMSTFYNRNGFYLEMVYNQGFSLVQYIGDTYGAEAVREAARTKSYFHFNRSLKKATGKKGRELYNDWVEYLKEKYGKVEKKVNENLIEGDLYFDGGFWDMYGTRSPDERYMAFISNKGYDVEIPFLYIMDTKTYELKLLHTGKITPEKVHQNRSFKPYLSTRKLRPPHEYQKYFLSIQNQKTKTGPKTSSKIYTQIVPSRPLWFPDGKKLYYSRYTRHSGYKKDIYVYDIEAQKEKQITWQARALDPALSPDGTTFAYINNKSGIQNLALVDVDGKNTRFLTNFNDGTQLYTPCWTGDGKKIILGIMFEDNRDIAIVNANAESFNRKRKLTDTLFFADSLNFQEDLEMELLINTYADERDPCVSSDGKFLYYSSDRTGIFNIYRMDLETGEIEQITDVLGGAIAPSINKSGNRVMYTGFHAANFNIYELTIESPQTFSLELGEFRDFSKRADKSKYIFSGSPKNGQYGTSEFKNQFTLWRFDPYLSFEPMRLTDTAGLTSFRLGLNLLTGDIMGKLNSFSHVYISKNLKNHAGPSWGADLATRVNIPRISGENRDFNISSDASIGHHVVKKESSFNPEFSGDVSGKIPNYQQRLLPPDLQSKKTEVFMINEPVPSDIDSADTIIALYLDNIGGERRYDRILTNFSISGNIAFNPYHSFNLWYTRSLDKLQENLYDVITRLQLKGLTIKNKTFDSNVRDITDEYLQNDAADKSSFFYQLLSNYGNYEDTLTDMLHYFDSYLYKDHRMAIQYGFNYPRVYFSVPDRFDIFMLTAQFVRATYHLKWLQNTDTTVNVSEDGKKLRFQLDSEGMMAPLNSSVKETKDYISFNVSCAERFPLPPRSKLSSNNKKSIGFRHFITAEAFLGTFNRKFSENPEVHISPLQYRASDFLSAYPHSYNPIDGGKDIGHVDVVYFTNDGAVYDSISYPMNRDSINRDILWGNGIAFYNFSYTAELLRGLTIPRLGMVIQGLYITPFVETANLWNRDWRDFKIKDLFPVNLEKLKLNKSALNDAGIRVELAFNFADTWNGYISFMWARRLSLGEMEEIGSDGTVVKHARDKFSLYFGVF